MTRIASFLFVMFMSAAANAAPLVVLVPGFFNSLAPGSAAGPYFSSAIVNTLEQRATVFVVSNLSPVGTVAENGELLATYLEGLSAKYPGQKVTLITHSAGAFYAFHALTTHPSLPVQNIVTLAGLYNGSEFIDNLTSSFPGMATVEKYIGLQSLGEFRAANSAQMLASFRIPDAVHIYALAGTQSSCLAVTCADAHYLSWILTLTGGLIPGASDGIVQQTSALATGITMRATSGKTFRPVVWSDLNVALEHWEMVVDASLFLAIGVVDTGYISSQQQYVYSEILNRLGY